MIKQRGVCNDSCENDPAHSFSLSKILSMPLCPLLLVNHQTRAETLPLGKPCRSIHYCMYGWHAHTQLLYALTVAQRSLVNRIRMTMTFNEHHTLDKAQQPVVAEDWLPHLKERLREYYEQVEIIGWTCTEEENVLPQDICTVPGWQVLRMELRVHGSKRNKAHLPRVEGPWQEGRDRMMKKPVIRR
jgi:hypothetical protein